MAIDLEIYTERRVVPVRFLRAMQGNPTYSKPDLDARGYGPTEHSPIVGLRQDKEITVRLERVLIDDAAPLYLTSSDDSLVEVIDPASALLPSGQKIDFKLKGIKGGSSSAEKANIEVRFGSKTGPVLHSLTVWCFKPRRLAVTPHIVTIAQTGGAVGPRTSTANVGNIMALVRRIWRPCGITFRVGTTQNDNVTFAAAGVVSQSSLTEINSLVTTNWVANTINAYFVPQIGTAGTLGLGISRPSSVSFGITNPAIILADVTAGGLVHDTMGAGNDLAHEIGHFLQLWHPNNLQPPNEREDTWCRHMLMHNFNPMGNGNLSAKGSWQRNVGYGNNRRGCMLTMKNLSTITTDGECATARSAAISGPY